MAMALQWQEQDDTLVLSGTLNRNTLGPLWDKRNALLKDKRSLDLKGLTRVDSVGLALLVHLQNEGKTGEPLQVQGINEPLKTLIILYNLQDIIGD